MSSEDAHLALAQRNQVAIDHLLGKPDDCAEWVVTVAFYKALHLVEAVFCHDGIGHGQNHERRDELLKRNRRYSHIYKHYRPLWAASIVARYLEDRDRNRGDTGYSSFSDYLSVADVQSQMLGHRLREIEKSVAKLRGK